MMEHSVRSGVSISMVIGVAAAAAVLVAVGLGWPALAHEEVSVPLGDERLVPVVFADEHVRSSPPSLDFGEVALGESVQRWLTVENVSSQVQSIVVSVAELGLGVTVAAGDESFDLAPGDAPREVELVFAPSSSGGAFTASAVVSATDPLGYRQETSVALNGSSATGLVSATPASLDFGEVLLSTTASLPLEVTNETAATLTVDIQPAPSWSGAPPISFSPSPPLDLSAGERRTIMVMYTPESGVDHLDTDLELTASLASGTTEDLKISVIGVVAENFAEVNPLFLDFGQVVVGQQARRSFGVRNLSRGEVEVLSILPAGQPLALDPGDDLIQLAVSGQGTVDVTFTPLSENHPPLTRITVLVTNEDGRIQRFFVDLAGQGVEPSSSDLSLVHPFTGAAISSLSFDTEVGSRASRTVRLVNSGEAVANGRIDGLGPLGGAPCWWDVCFTLAGTQIPASPYSLGAGQHLDIDVAFEPVREWGPTSKELLFLGEAAPPSLTVTVTAEDPGETDDVVVDAHLILDHAAHDFGSLTSGQSAETTIRLTNSGTDTAEVSLLGVDAFACAFEVCFEPLSPGVNLLDFSLAASASLDIQVVFAPSEEHLPFQLAAHFVGGAEPAVFTASGSAASAGAAFGGGTLTPVPLDLQGFRGMVNDNTFLSSTELDHVSLMTGNLVVTLPLGQEYRIGPRLTHGLSLVYNASAWDATTTDQGLPWGNNILNPKSAPAWGSNAGLGWRLSLGELYERNGRAGVFADLNQAPHWPNRSQSLDWLYVAPDGSRIYFEPGAGGVYHSRGGSFLRLKQGPGGVPDPVTIEFPDGTEHEYGQSSTQCDRGSRCWRLEKIRDSHGNEATIAYLGFATNTPTIEIRYPHGRTSRILLNRSKAAGAGAADLGDLRFLITFVQVPGFGGTTATYGFRYAGDPGTRPSGEGEPDYRQRIVRGCPANVQAGDQQRMSVPVLRHLDLPTGDDYVFSYDVDTDPTGDSCHLASGTLTQMELPTDAKVQYRWGTNQLPTLCTEHGDNAPPGELSVSAPFSLSPRVAARQLVRSDGSPGGWTEYFTKATELEDHFFGDPSKQCNRNNLLITDVVHGPNLGSETDAEYRVDRFYHTTTRPGDVGDWRRAAYGLPIHLGSTGSTDFGTDDVWLSSETANCPEPDFEAAGCVVERRDYKHYRWLGGGGCNLQVDRPECHRTLDAVDLERQTFGGGEEPWWIDTRHTNYDGRGHYRHSETRSNFHWQSGTVTTTSEHTEYLGGSSFPNTGQIYTSLPGASAPWQLNLYTAKRSNPDGRERVTELDFDPATGFLRCQRQLETLVVPGAAAVRSAEDVATRFDRGQSNGYVVWEETAGGDGGNLPTGSGVANLCPDAAASMDFRTLHTYSGGERAISQPKNGSGGNIGPPTLYQEIDPSTGLPSAICGYASSPPTCERHTYDSVGRLTGIDRGWELAGSTIREKMGASAHLADTSYTYSTTDGGKVTARVQQSGGPAIRQESEIYFDGLGLETSTRVRSLVQDASRWVRRTVYHHERGFRTVEMTPELGQRAECVGNTLCRNTFRHDIYGREIFSRTPALNRSQGEPPLPPWVTPEVREETRMWRGLGLIHDETTRQFFCDGDTVTRQTRDHLDRVVRVQESLDGMFQNSCPANGVRRTTTVTYQNGVQTTSRDPGAVGGPKQTRTETRDGRGFLIEEIHPEWQDGVAPLEKATYEYDALGNLTYEEQPDGTRLWYRRDGRGRLEEVFTGSELVPQTLKSFTYEPATGQMATSQRIHRLDNDTTFGFFDGDTATVEEIFGYDLNGLLETRTTRLFYQNPPGANDRLYDVTQRWLYNDLGQIRQIEYPDCLATGLRCGSENGGAPDRTVNHTYTHGQLRELSRDGARVTRHDYHPNGIARRIDYYRGGVRQWHDDITTGPFGAPTVTRIESFDDSEILRWDTGEYLFNGRGNLRTMFPTLAFEHDEFDRQTDYNRFGRKQSYLYDDYDNLLETKYFDNSGALEARHEFQTSTTSNRLERVTRYEPQANIGFGIGSGEEVVFDITGFVYDGRGQLQSFDQRSFFGYGPFGESTAYLRERFGQTTPNPGNGYEYQSIHLYNAGGERVATVDRKEVSGADQNLILFFGRDQDGQVLREFRWTLDAAGEDVHTWKDYYWGNGRLLGIEEEVAGQAKLLHAHVDHLGSLRSLSDGQVLDSSQEFYPWGERVPPELGGTVIPQRVGFTGQEIDRNDLVFPASDGYGLTQDFGARDYVPIAGRFFTPDPGRDPSTWSLYGYAGNNPVMNNDPTGLQCNEATAPTGGCAPTEQEEEEEEEFDFTPPPGEDSRLELVDQQQEGAVIVYGGHGVQVSPLQLPKPPPYIIPVGSEKKVVFAVEQGDTLQDREGRRIDNGGTLQGFVYREGDQLPPVLIGPPDGLRLGQGALRVNAWHPVSSLVDQAPPGATIIFSTCRSTMFTPSGGSCS